MLAHARPFSHAVRQTDKIFDTSGFSSFARESYRLQCVYFGQEREVEGQSEKGLTDRQPIEAAREHIAHLSLRAGQVDPTICHPEPRTTGRHQGS